MGNVYLPQNISRLFTVTVCVILFNTAKAQPTIISFSPANGPIGTSVTISGNNFNPIARNNFVYFGAVQAMVTNATPTALTVSVPAGATYAPISVTTGGLTAYSSLPFVVTSLAGGGAAFQPGSFASPINVSTGSRATTVFASDVDGDGKPDMVSVNANSNTLSVYRNTSITGTLAFSPKVDFATGSFPQMVFMGDVDGDGKPDAIVPNYTSGTVSVFKNISTPGTISFAAKVDFTVGTGPQDAVIGDVDGDGKPDIVTTNNTAETVSILKNTSGSGFISFAAKIDLPTWNNPQNAVLTDLDGDRKPEIAVINGGASSVYVYQNTSTITAISFASKIIVACETTPNYIVAGDLDSDGKPDLAIACYRTVTVLRNSSSAGAISFARSDHSTGLNNFVVSMGDIDGDGKPDLAVNNFSGNKVALLRNSSSNANINFEPEVNYTTLDNPFGNALCDFDGDGLSDLAVVNFGSNIITVRRNTTNNPNSPNISSFSPTSAGTGLEVIITGTNLDGATSVTFGGVAASSFTVVSPTTVKAIVGSGASGNVEIITANGSAWLGGFVYTTLPTITSFNPANGGQGSVITITGTNFLGTTNVSFGGVAASSFEVISPTTIRAVVDTGASGIVSVTNSYGVTTRAGFVFYTSPTITSFTPEKGGTGTEVTINGINLLGVTKVTIGTNDATSFTVISPVKITAIVGQVVEGYIPVSVSGPNGEASLPGFYTGPTITSFSPASGPAGTVVTIQGTHFSSDPSLNIVKFGASKATVSVASDNRLQVVAPLGSTFQPLTVTKNNLTAASGKPFISTFNNASEELDVTSFNANNEFKAGDLTLGVSVSDLNDDGKPDVVVCNFASNTVSVFKNISKAGLIMLESKIDLGTGEHPYESFLNDIDGDAKPDLMVLNNSENSMSIYRNESVNGQVIFGLKQDFQTGGTPRSIAAEDLNGDGKPDIIVGNTGGGLSFFKNTGTVGNITLEIVPGVYNGGSVYGVSISDYNNDGMPDISVTTDNDRIAVFRNTSKYGVISFSEKINLEAGFSPSSIMSGDLDGDGLIDIAAVNPGNNNFSVYKNSGTNGAISFMPRTSYQTESNLPYGLKIGDLNGNGKPDIAVANSQINNIALFNNRSVPGSLAIESLNTYSTGFGSGPRSIAIADMDGDGKPDIVSSRNYSSIVILRNTLTENASLDICELNNGADLVSSLTGSTYQWQVDDGTGYVNVEESGYYSGVNSKVLHISIPSEWYGYKYRCVVDGSGSQPITVHVVNNWIGGSNADWNNYANWSCGAVPNADTDVFIKTGTVMVNSNSSCRSLVITPGVNLIVSPGVTFTVTH